MGETETNYTETSNITTITPDANNEKSESNTETKNLETTINTQRSSRSNKIGYPYWFKRIVFQMELHLASQKVSDAEFKNDTMIFIQQNLCIGRCHRNQIQ
nr:hypothetical protein [uncultured Flavobacterium sp.]